jgi:hypothetical protein
MTDENLAYSMTVKMHLKQFTLIKKLGPFVFIERIMQNVYFILEHCDTCMSLVLLFFKDSSVNSK